MKCEDGFVLSYGDGKGDNNRILDCKAINNKNDGIVVGAGATGNHIIHNKAWYNKYDLHDENDGCDDNVWGWNKFFKKEPEEADCIK